MENLGFTSLPAIIWRKPTNSPNKFLGSGSLPPGAYVTQEHEHILIFRKHGKREFITEQEREKRMESSYFWEERNMWFSDQWNGVKGVRQSGKIGIGRERSAEFPMEVPYRLVNMFSIKGDTVLDPFSGTGTTSLAAMASGRNSIGYEINRELYLSSLGRMEVSMEFLNSRIRQRMDDHVRFMENREKEKPSLYLNELHGFKVVGKNEAKIRISKICSIRRDMDNTIVCTYQ